MIFIVIKMMKAYHDGPTGTIIMYLIGLVLMIKKNTSISMSNMNMIEILQTLDDIDVIVIMVILIIKCRSKILI